MTDTVMIDKKLFDQLRMALVIADDVLCNTQFTGLDQNPKGIRDLVGSASLAIQRVKVPT